MDPLNAHLYRVGSALYRRNVPADKVRFEGAKAKQFSGEDEETDEDFGESCNVGR